MPAKADFGRDYYADLELPPTADVSDIKKQFRKLALKYHPDRNPGRETEVNAQFQTIQSAHEILTSPEQKSKYDAHRNRRTSRYPAASGVRGNPWKDAAAQFPPPPARPGSMPQNPFPSSTKRPGATSSQNTPSGANRYSSFNVPRPRASNPPAQDDSASRYTAWRNMRPGAAATAAAAAGTGGTAGAGGAAAAAKAKSTFNTTKPTTSVPPPTARSASQRQKAQASFGVRKSGFAPRTPYGDEPSVPSSNYSTTRTHTNLFNDTPANTRRARRASSNVGTANMFRDSFLDSRQPTPYQSHGGEKLDVFDGASPHRAKSTRERPGPGDGVPGPDPTTHPRSSSAPGDTEDAARSAREQVPGNPTPADATSNGGASSTSRYGDRYKPRGQGTQPRNAFVAENTVPNGSAASTNGGFATSNDGSRSQATGNSTGYADSYIHLPPHPASPKMPRHGATPRRNIYTAIPTDLDASEWDNLSPELRVAMNSGFPSGYVRQPGETMNAFEIRQFHLLRKVINETSPFPKIPRMAESSGSRVSSAESTSASSNRADLGAQSSFNFVAPPAGVAPSTPDQHRFMRNSAESINTRFVEEDHANTNWQFNTGAPTGPDAARSARRSQSSSRLGRSPTKMRQTPLKSGPSTGMANRVNGAEKTTASTSFDAGEWTEKIGPELFAPQPLQAAVSPTRPILRPSKKPRAVHRTAGTAGLVDEEGTSSSDDKTRPETAAGSTDGGVDSPNAMDIDPPAAEPSVALPANGARAIPVEPSRPEWRAGAVPGAGPPAAPGGFGQHLPTFATDNAAGSEDADGFKTSFADFKNVAPFADAPSGLSSFGELKSSLPFESKPSARIPITRPARKTSIKFPRPPAAPRPPPVLALSGMKPSDASWNKYVADFDGYMNHWANFNTQYVDHFAARRGEIEKQRREGGFAWLSTRGDTGVQEYATWLEQDREVRAKWDSAATEHEQRVREFMGHRVKMMM